MNSRETESLCMSGSKHIPFDTQTTQNEVSNKKALWRL